MDSMTQSEYWGEIEELARTIPQEARDRGEDPDDVLHETLDGHRYIIYSHLAQQVIQYSANDMALFENLGPQEADDWSTLFSRGAYFAMREDVIGHSEWLTAYDEADDDSDEYDEVADEDEEEQSDSPDSTIVASSPIVPKGPPCPTCGNPLTELFSSSVCDHCSPRK